MTEKQNSLLITPSLLNSWRYIDLCSDSVRESESDTISLEDKITDRQEKAFHDFLNYLEKKPMPANEYMLAGIEFEKECYEGKTPVSPIIEGGAFQISGTKEIVVDGIPFTMYGRLDVLKGGVIYDIKRVVNYVPQKYINSTQHGFYLELFPNAKKFTYLAFDGNRLHTETYYRDEVLTTATYVSDFVRFLKENNLFDTYVSKWKSKPVAEKQSVDVLGKNK